MPDFYAKGKYDLSGFAVGIVKRILLLMGKTLWLEMYSLAYLLAESIQMVSFVRRLATFGKRNVLFVVKIWFNLYDSLIH
ncbi:hypothetical protein PTKIN_Ptkin12aG0142100 [Pterospermum kingtungense]